MPSCAAGSVVDLHALLPAGVFRESEAEGIDADGNIVGVAFPFDQTGAHAILWRVVPEPGGITILAGFAAGTFLRRRRNA